MRHTWLWRSLVVGLCASGGFFAACSSGSGSGGGNGNGADGSVAPTSCTNGALKVVFSPMYTAFDGKHSFQVPAVVDGIKGANVTWSVSDPSVAAIAADNDTGGVMITAQKAGTVTVVASAGSLCGSSILNVTQASPDDWEVGNQRYNDGVVLRRPSPDAGDAGNPREAACTNCHGDNSNGPIRDVEHTPQQTGGFSDDDLVNIFTKGQVPDGGYFDDSIIPYAFWQRFHKWDMTPDEAKGIVVYLRSLTPQSQGPVDFGGRSDGGPRPPRPASDSGTEDAGGGAPPDSDAAADAPTGD